MTNRVMLDAYTPKNLIGKVGPSTILAAYINGANTSGNMAEMKAIFPDNQYVPISTDGDLTVVAAVADCETGDYTPASGARWARNMVNLGPAYPYGFPTLYCGRDNYPRLVQAMLPLAIHFGVAVDCWLSTLDGTQEVPAGFVGVVAIQWTNHLGAYDESVVIDPDWQTTGGRKMGLNQPITCAYERPNHPGSGWRFAADGGVFPYGGAPFLGNPPEQGLHLNAPIVAAVVSENGYVMIGADGGSFAYGTGNPSVPSLA